MGHLTGLPPEMLDSIIQQFQGHDIKSIRATCHRLHRVASPFLFPVLYLSCHPLYLTGPYKITNFLRTLAMRGSATQTQNF